MTSTRPLFILFILLSVVFSYAGSLNGQPIWDDYPFIFWTNGQINFQSHINFWRSHIWPLFDSVSALLYQWWGEKTIYWHFLNLALHVINGLLLAHLVRPWCKRWALPVLLIFLIHPLNVMSVAWIIQLKTLLSALFILLALVSFRHWSAKPHKKWYLLSVFSFFLSVSAKSSALPVPWLLLFFALPNSKRLHWLKLLAPFLLITLWSTWRIWDNQQVKKAIIDSEVAIQKVIEAPVEVPPTPSTPVTQPLPAPIETVTAVEIAPVVAVAPAIEPPSDVVTAVNEPKAPTKKNTVLFILSNLGSYLVMPWFPWPLSPIHGIFDGSFDARAIAGLLLIVTMLGLGLSQRSSLPLKCLIFQAGLLVPVLGIVMVPYMSYTSISEQHFYFILPFAIVTQLWLIEIFFQRQLKFFVAMILFVFLVLTTNYAQIFRNEEAFYRYILKQDAYNPVATINLAAYYSQMGVSRPSLMLIDRFLSEAENRPKLKSDPHYPTALRAKEYYMLQP